MAGEGNKGWISLYRTILDGWLWEDKPFARGQAWIDLLLQANHKDSKKLSKGELVEIKRGSLLTSDQILADRWGWSRKKVRAFLSMLEKEQMITLNRTKKGTSLSIKKYSFYQNRGTTEDTTEDTTEEQQRNNRGYTNNNDNNVNNDNNKITTTICGSDEEFNIYKFLEKCNFILSSMLVEKIQADIEIYSLEEVKKAIEIADSNGKHTYSYVKGILERRRAKMSEEAAKEKAREQAFKEFLEED